MLTKILGRITVAHVVLILEIATLMFVAGIYSYANYSNQVRDQALDLLNKTLIDKSNLQGNISAAGVASILKSLGTNQKQIINNTNQTNTLVKFLTDNFGEKSGYIERENFQYKQANDTFAAINNTNSQVLDSEKNIIGNLSDHRRIANITRDSDNAKLDEILNILRNASTSR